MSEAGEEAVISLCLWHCVQAPAIPPITLALAGLRTTHSPSLSSGSPEEQKALWIKQLLHLVEKKNSLVAEEAELMIK